MRRKVSAFFAVALAMLLSVALAVPASADASSDFWANLANQQKPGGTYQYKYGFDYYKSEWKPTAAGQTALNAVRTPLPVAPTVHPSSTGPSWYLNQYRNRGIVPGTNVLTGTIVEPGKTLVRTPSTYAPVTKFATTVGAAGSFAASRFLGTLFMGMGGTSLAPTNRNELALSQGVSAGCVDGSGSCTPDEIAKKFAIDSCGIKGTCNAIGAEGADRNSAQQDWFKQNVLSPLDDLWAGLTGQKNDLIPSDVHVQLASPNGCRKEAGFEYTGGQTGKVYYRGEIVKPRPTFVAQYQNWDAGCSNLSARQNVPFQFTTECIDPATGLTANPSNGVIYGKSVGTLAADLDATTSTFKPGTLCGSGTSVPSTVVPFKVRFWNSITEAMYASTSGSFYGVPSYSEWINPDPNLNNIENIEITTTWSCATSDGVVYQFSSTVKKTAAIPAPDCPPGSTLKNHEVKAKTPSGTETIDAGAAVPGAMAKFPGCEVTGCALDVYLDGTVCTPARAECHTWPAVTARQPSRVICKWGGHVVPTSDCNVLSNGYKTETGVVFDPKSGTWVGVDTYGNPVDANPEPWNPTNPNPVPGATPGTPPATGTPTGTFPQTGTNPTTSDNCSSPVWSWNPVEWVKNPVVCALLDAFVPKTDIQARIQGISTAAADTVPISWISTPIVGPSGGGCPNWNINVAGLSQNVVCESSFTAAIVGARGPMFGIVASAMIWPLIRGIWYALIPIVRVSPSGSR